MLTKDAIEEILESRENLTEYVTASMIQAISIGVDKVKAPDASPNAVAALIEALRKARGDLTGDVAQANMPQMMVNIQFSGQGQPQCITTQPAKSVIEGTPPSALSELENVDEQSDD